MLTINATIRVKRGKSASRYLRTINKIPAIIYGGKEKELPITIDHNSVFNMQNEHEFYHNIILIMIHDKKIQVKVKAVQRHPFKIKLNHIDFMRI